MKPKGFSLLEMIGVMAVMAIMAGALAPSVFQLIEEGYQDAEEQSLKTIAQALERSISNRKVIPTQNVNDWSNVVADYASLPPQRVSANDKHFSRRMYADPMFFNTSNQNFAGYSQTQGLVVAPHSPRLMLVSSLIGNVSTNLTTHAQFSDVWEQTADAQIVESKTLKIERINLNSLFVRVVLTNASTQQTGFALEGATEGAIAANSSGVDGARSIYVLAGTHVVLNAAPYPGGTGLRQFIVRDQKSLRYELQGSAWTWVE